MSSEFTRTCVALALALVAGVGTAGFAAAPAFAGGTRSVCNAQTAPQLLDERARARCEAVAKARAEMAAATGFRMGTIGVPATPILH